ncbi:tetratricopeptide repeat protein gnn, partial [Plakobranchus ocellatus]
MADNVEFQLRDAISPYVCSTPLDFTEERNYLSRVVFPQLNQLCKSRGSFFNPTDLRWTPGDPNTERGYLLTTVLSSIKKSSPFFICLLGETYGPFREQGRPSLSLSSVTGSISGSSNSSSFFPAPRRSKPGPRRDSRGVTASTVAPGGSALTHEGTYAVGDGAGAKEGQSDWLDKNFLLAGRGGHPWVLQEGHQNSSITELEVTQGVLLCDSLYSTLYYRQSDHLDDKLERAVNKKAQQSFIKSRTQVTSPGVENTLQTLTDFAFDSQRASGKGDLLDELFATPTNNTKIRSYSATSPYKKKPPEVDRRKSILLLAGDRGVGKSSLAAKWLTDFQAENSPGAAGIPVIAHFVAASNNSADLVGFIKHCISRLREVYLLSEPHDPLSIRAAVENESEAKDPSFRSLCEAFTAALGLGPCVILLDGLNELTSARGLTSREVKEFAWLHESLPGTCKLILTTTRSDITYRCLLSRKDVTVLNCPDSLLDPQNTLTMVKEHCPLLSQLVGGDARLQKVSQLKIMSTALGARVVASEVSCHRIYSNLHAFLEDCAEVWSLRDFWIMTVKNWILEHNWTVDTPASEIFFVESGFDFSGWVMDSLCLIAVSRNGLTANQILSLLEVMGYNGELQVTSYDWLQFRLSAGSTLREKEDGRLVFGHRYLQEIAEYLFFKSMASVSYDPAMILKLASSGPRQIYHAQIGQFFSREPLDTQVLEELPWQLMWSGQIGQLMDFLTDCGALLKMLSTESIMWQQDLKLYWSVCQLQGYQPATVYLHLSHALGILDTDSIQIPEEDRYEGSESPRDIQQEPNPRIVVSTPEPHNAAFDGTDHIYQERKYFEENAMCFDDIEIEYNLQSDLGHLDKHDTEGNGHKEPQAFEEDGRTGMFLTQEDIDNDAVIASGTVDKGDDPGKDDAENNFPGLASLCWHLSRFLQALGENEASKVILNSLIKYIKQNYPLTLEQHLVLCRCHHALGALTEITGDLNLAEMEYRQALRALVAAEDMDDDLSHVEDTKYLKARQQRIDTHSKEINVKIIKLQRVEISQRLLQRCQQDNGDEHTTHIGVGPGGDFQANNNLFDNLITALLLSCHGNLRVLGNDLYEAEELLKEGLECIEDNPNCFLLKSAIFANLGQLRYAQCDFPRAESCLREAIKLRCHWFGRCHSLVADILVSLAQLLSAPGNVKGQDVIQAEHLFRQALIISEKCFGATSLSVASVLFCL